MAQSRPQCENSTSQPAHNTPIALTLNCGYFRTVIRELIPKRKGIHGRTLEISKLVQEMSELFCVPGYGFETIQSCHLFEKKCNQILNVFQGNSTLLQLEQTMKQHSPLANGSLYQMLQTESTHSPTVVHATTTMNLCK